MLTKRSFFKGYIVALLLFPLLVWGQGTYYNGIDTGSASFVNDLHNLIYPHTQISYDNYKSTIIPNFESRDTTGGQRVVTCVYSGQNFVYTAPFAWGTFSREHTWCYSWMPTYGSTSGKEYSDQHHLFPTNQNNANGIRSNHPLGTVSTITSSYLLSKYGKNSSSQNVFEPRDSHKGDAARALLYMAVCYNGVNGKDWSFNYLNTVTLPALGEASEDLNTLVQWHNQDPPDQWEKDRNEYIYSIQGNRNPFIDHPEYVGIIDFNTLTKKTTASLADEPTYYPKGFSSFSPTITDTSITVQWADTNGVVLAAGYLLKANTSSVFTDPSDGVVYSDDTNLTDGSAVVNISYSAPDTFRFGGLNSATTYYFKMWPYNGNGSARKYKTANFPSLSLYNIYLTSGSGSSTPSVVINEYFNGTTGVSEWIELLVLQDNLNMQGLKIRDYSSGGALQNEANPLQFLAVPEWESVPSGTFIVIFKSGAGTPTEDLDFSDKKVIINSSNGNYFSTPSTPFDIAGTADAVEIFSPGGTHIHSLSHGSKPGNIVSLAAPTANITGSSSSGNVVRFINVSNTSDFALSTKVQHSSTATMGTANDVSESNFISTVLPVELTSFSAAVQNTNVILRWSTSTEVNNYGFEIQKRRIQKSEVRNQKSEVGWSSVGFVEGNGTTNTPKEYLFTDKDLSAGKYSYRLKQIERDGKFEYSQEVEATIASTPKGFVLEQNYPNPFNPTTVISYQIPVNSHVSLKVYDVLGREAATLVNDIQDGGYYSAAFDGSKLSSGVYFAKLQSGDKVQLMKMLMVK